MPQLNFTVFPSQLFWLCITFFVMLLIMSKLIIPRIAEMINLRKEKIDGYLENAAEIKTKAEGALDKYHQALQSATDEANQSLQRIQQDIKNTIERKQADLAEQLNHQIREGEEQIQVGKDKAKRRVEKMSEELALAVLHKLGFNRIEMQEIESAAKIAVKE